MSTPAYPPAPWDLEGQMHVHSFIVRASELPATPEGFEPLVLAGRGLVGVGWVDYAEGSMLSYGELFAAVLGRANGKLTATVTHMWVDSPASRAGGRELWGYPKELAEFTLRIDPSGTAIAHAEGGELAHGSYQAILRVGREISTAGGTTQPQPGGLTLVKALVRGKPSIGRGRIAAPPSSPLAFVNGATKLMSVGLKDFRFRFGV